MATGFRDIQQTILQRIQRGELPPGSLLPSEVDLAAEFGVARATMSRALQLLADDGILERRRKAGTRVALAPVRHAKFEIPLVQAEIEALGTAYQYQLLERKLGPPPPWLAARIGGEMAAEVVYVSCLHLAGSTPFQEEIRWINPAAVPQVLDADFANEGPNGWLIREVPFTEVEMQFQAEAADAQTAARLGMQAGDPVFCAERVTWRGVQPVTFAQLRFARGYAMKTAHKHAG